MDYDNKINKIVDNTTDLIIEELGQYTTDNLNDIIIGLLGLHILTSKDSIQNLIDLLERIKENY